ncbi:sulfite exporter TauE/SafE family protein [Georgenia yuyongxinii]|uniref:Probable membrane transporter protein n=1 Tax=Georgenia yuyongxinii TaxID=2589797 RepID=A0A5B8C029_9MICO|nr:sulfite exporter TauE/SafE family protein [Georgenia yuyongxinii]QDC23437.1 sulfite exporter TauE/SafE family protein [Georgenia yuyongxinii]
MLTLSTIAWVVLAVAAFLVGVGKTALPGVGTITVALFATVLPARESTGALLALLIVGDLFAVWSYRSHADLVILRRLVPTVLVGVLAGTAFLAVADDAVVRRVIGAVLLVLIALTLVQRAVAVRRRVEVADPGQGGSDPAGPRRARAAAYGVLGGFTTMVANAGGPVMSLYFLASRLPVLTFLGTAAWFFFAVNLAKVPFSVGLGLITAESLLLDLLLVPALLLGTLLGRRLARRISQKVFDRLILTLTVVAAVYLMV